MIDVFIITNKPNNIAINTAKKLNIFNYFKAIIGDGVYPYRKPDINIWNNLKKDYNLIEDKTMYRPSQIAFILYGVCKHDYYINSFYEVYDFVINN